MLDSWKNKRMTGLRLSWRIENKNPPLMASISEVGRSIQTPHFGDILDDASDASTDNLYKVTLMPPQDLSQQIRNKSLVIELDINRRVSYEMFAFTSYKLYKKRKTWTEAALHCESEGGQLASIHSQWEQMLAEKAAESLREEEEFAWLGGRRNLDQWQWHDNSSWSFTNWKSDDSEQERYVISLRMNEYGYWYGAGGSNYYRGYFLCQGTTAVLAENGLTTIEFNKEQMAFFPFHVIFKSHKLNRQNPPLNSSSGEKIRISGFSLKWFLKDSNGTVVTEKLPARQEDWKRETPTPSYKQPLLQDIVQLARELRLQNKTGFFQEVIYQKLQTGIMTENGVCSMGQVKADEQKRVVSKVGFTFNTTKSELTDGDIETGYDLFHAAVFCPSAMVFKLCTIMDHLLSVETTRTIIQTMVNLFQSEAITNETSFNLAKSFYQVLASTLDLLWEYSVCKINCSTTSRYHKKPMAVLRQQY